MTPSRATVPVTVIGGFLGAGKTTFVNHLLATSTSRTAVLVNDFGEVNIDASLIANRDGDTMTLTNGCICCSVGTGFIDTISKVLDAPVPHERIVIEASGVGDPWAIAEIALIEPGLRLGRVIVLADASRIVRLVDDPHVGDTVRRQFDRCDMALLSKSDLVDAAGLDAARAAVLGQKPALPIIETTHGMMPTLTELEAGNVKGPFKADSPSTGKIDHGQRFSSWCYRRNGVFDRDLLAAALARMPPQLLRLKGSCRLHGESGYAIIQMVDKTWALSPCLAADADRDADIMLIGVGTADLLPSAVLDTILDCALVVSETVQ